MEVDIILDSINSHNNRITTWVLKYPRIIHSEMMTHRMFSRNSSSSRAIPISKTIENCKNNPFIPNFTKSCKGMKSNDLLEGNEAENAKNLWLTSLHFNIDIAQKLSSLKTHKQHANRLLEPFSYITVLLTGTEFENFFALRANEEAQPEFQALAYKMLEVYNNSRPRLLGVGGWHIPFGDKYCDNLLLIDKLKVCVARAARVSYNNFEGKIDFEKDKQLHDKLINSGHFSCFEHCAANMNDNKMYRNFRGWRQYRTFIADENRTDGRVKRG